MQMNEEEICGDREGEERKTMKEELVFKNQEDEDLEKWFRNVKYICTLNCGSMQIYLRIILRCFEKAGE